MSEGALLNRELSCNYGPLPELVQAGLFRLWGPGLDVIIWLNIAVTAGIIALLWGIFSALGDRLSGWLCGVVFVAVFAVPFYGDSIRSLFNYIAPYSCQLTWGFGGVLLVVYSLMRHAAHGRRGWLLVAGAGLGIAFLDKPEMLLGALGVAGLYLGLRLVELGRSGGGEGGFGKSLGTVAGWACWGLAGFLAAYLPVFLIFAKEGGWAYGFQAANWTLQVFLDPAYARSAHSYFQDALQGLDHPWTNLLAQVGWGAVMLAFGAVLAWAGRGWQRAQEEGRAGQGQIGLVMALGFLVVLLTHWLSIGRALLVPVVLLGIIAVGGALRGAWRGEAVTVQRTGLALVAAMAMLLLVRMILNVRICNYGFVLAVPATLLVVHVLVYELPRRCGSAGQANGLLQMTFMLLVLAGAADLARQSLANYAHRSYPVGAGRDLYYSYTPDINGDGAMLNIITSAMERYFGEVKTVVALPESQAVNYRLRKKNPVVEMQFTPDLLQMVGLENEVAALAANPPEAIILTAREMNEYGVAYFGVDDASGWPLLDWVMKNYQLAFTYGKTTLSVTGHDIDIFIRRDLARSPPTAAPAPASINPSLLNMVH